jgi:hypothetical protein
VLDRGWGKPTQAIDANVSFFDGLTDHDRQALLAALEAIQAGYPTREADFSRLRALALFGRRPPECEARLARAFTRSSLRSSSVMVARLALRLARIRALLLAK